MKSTLSWRSPQSMSGPIHNSCDSETRSSERAKAPRPVTFGFSSLDDSSTLLLTVATVSQETEPIDYNPLPRVNS